MSFEIIIIAKNEAETLPIVFDRCIELSKLIEIEKVIYVDSNSTDQSVLLADDFAQNNTQIKLEIIKDCVIPNPAFARNAGIESLDQNSEQVMFVDGDVVFETNFVVKALDILRQEGSAGTVTGPLYDYFYKDSQSTYLRHTPSLKNGCLKFHGGNFITNASVIHRVGGFDQKLTKHQDIDYCFRIRNCGYRLLYISENLGMHYTQAYSHLKRLKCDLLEKKYLSTGILFRKYLFSRNIFDLLQTGSIRMALFRAAIISFFITGFFYHALFVIPLLLTTMLLFKTKKSHNETYLSRLISILIGLEFVAGIFSFGSNKITNEKGS